MHAKPAVHHHVLCTVHNLLPRGCLIQNPKCWSVPSIFGEMSTVPAKLPIHQVSRKQVLCLTWIPKFHPSVRGPLWDQLWRTHHLSSPEAENNFSKANTF